MSNVEDLAAARVRRYEVRYERKGNTDHLILPPEPGLKDVAGQCAWITSVFALDREHPVISGERQGVFGPEGHVELRRAGAPSIRFEPVTRINTPMKLIESVTSRMLPTDGKVPPLKGEHCREIAYVVRMLCGAADAMSDEQETSGIVGTFMACAQPIEGLTTYETTGGQRYEAALALRRELDSTSGRPSGPPRYLIDSTTGELVIGVSDLADAARRHIGSGVPRGWLDGRMDGLGWRRITLDGHALPGRDGRKGPHARINAYRGVLATDDISVTT
jgi:hypothetical protein